MDISRILAIERSLVVKSGILGWLLMLNSHFFLFPLYLPTLRR